MARLSGTRTFRAASFYWRRWTIGVADPDFPRLGKVIPRDGGVKEFGARWRMARAPKTLLASGSTPGTQPTQEHVKRLLSTVQVEAEPGTIDQTTESAIAA